MSIAPIVSSLFAGLTLGSLVLTVWLRIADHRANRSRLGVLVPARLTVGGILAAVRRSPRA